MVEAICAALESLLDWWQERRDRKRKEKSVMYMEEHMPRPDYRPVRKYDMWVNSKTREVKIYDGKNWNRT